MKKILSILALLAVAVVANATVSLSPTVQYVYEQNGTTKFDPGQLFLLVIDKNNDGFGVNGDGKIGVGFELGSDDWIAKAWNSGSGLALGKISPASSGMLLEGEVGAPASSLGFNTGDAFGFFFFDNISTTQYNADTLSVGQKYGFYTQDSFDVPSVGGTFSTAVTGKTLLMDQTVIPEPATALLALIGGTTAYVLRRKQNLLA